MKNLLTRFIADESGASAAEYALILAIVGSAIAFAAVSLGTTISSAMSDAEDCINNPPATTGGTCGTGGDSGGGATNNAA